jgi:spore coat protein CotH
VLALTLLLTLLLANYDALGIVVEEPQMGYETRLFDKTTVHTLDIVMNDWDSFIENCESEEYSMCTVVIDNEKYKNVAIRAKGNTSLSQVSNYGNDRYSFKIEFDHYDSTETYHGLDKLSLNNIIQDNTYMKDFLCYTMMYDFGVSAPLCSYVYIRVNGEDWGLYLAVEGVEDAFLERNYGADSGELYKPDSLSMGGGRGNGGDFDMDEFSEKFGLNGNSSDGSDDDTAQQPDNAMQPQDGDGQGGDGQGGGKMPDMPQGGDGQGGDGQSDFSPGEMPDMSSMFENMELPDGVELPEDFDFSDLQEMIESGEIELPDGFEMPDGEDFDFSNFDFGGGFGGGDMGGGFGGGDMSNGMGSDDVKLQYIDDDPDSYSDIFDSAKTDITEADEERLIAAIKAMNEGDTSAVDVDQVMRYFVVHGFVCNGDSYTGSMVHNYYLYEDDGVLSMIPWDYNLAFGGFDSAGGATSLVNSPIDSPVTSGDISDRPMVAWIFDSDETTEEYHEYYAEFIEQYFTSGYFEQLFDSTVELISPYVEKDPTAFCTYDEFLEGTEALREFCLLRAESVSGQLDGTIPSTSDGQSADSSALIDAGDLSITAMGTMNIGGGQGGGDMGGGFGGGDDKGGFGGGDAPEKPEDGEEPSDAPEKPDEGSEQPDNAPSDTEQGDAPEMPDGTGEAPSDDTGGQMPDMPQGGDGQGGGDMNGGQGGGDMNGGSSPGGDMPQGGGGQGGGSAPDGNAPDFGGNAP